MVNLEEVWEEEEENKKEKNEKQIKKREVLKKVKEDTGSMLSCLLKSSWAAVTCC